MESKRQALNENWEELLQIFSLGLVVLAFIAGFAAIIVLSNYFYFAFRVELIVDVLAEHNIVELTNIDDLLQLIEKHL